ncbi:type VI secretion system baseplate subunit TssK [Panacagrimonas sp.]|uniref:type VI secretion system baseplate subunit TssK n=1 Tax=Panacagrimonas sp. TaxID=2480088 RepID=UPI003B51EBFE
MSWSKKVVWSEGMFLQPQHFQQQDRYLERTLENRVGETSAYPWGFAHLVIDEAALALGKVSLTAARGVLPDGTPFDFPDSDDAPLALEIPPDSKSELLMLAAPARRHGSTAVDADGEDGASFARYRASDLEVTDHNSGSESSAPLRVADLKLRLLPAREKTDGWVTLGVTRVLERRADNLVVLDRQYIPPTLAVSVSPVLSAYLQEIEGMLHQRGEALSSRLAHPGRGGVAEISDFLFLQTVNRYEPLIAHLRGIGPLHPERLYQLGVTMAGDFATFRDNRRPIAYPRYLHPEPEKCFPPLMKELRASLSVVMETKAVPIELQERKFGVRVAVIPDQDLVRTAGFVLAVNAQVPAEQLRVRFPAQVKIGPAEKLRDLVNMQLPGIALKPLPVAPRQIPFHAGFNYFELERGTELWKQLERGSGLAMHIAGEFPGLEMECWAIRS